MSHFVKLMTAIICKLANYTIGVALLAMPVSVMAQSIGIMGEKAHQSVYI